MSDANEDQTGLGLNGLACAAALFYAIAFGSQIAAGISGIIAFLALAYCTFRVINGDKRQIFALPVTATIVLSLTGRDIPAFSNIASVLQTVALVMAFGAAAASFYLRDRSPVLIFALGIVTGCIGLIAFSFAAEHTFLGNFVVPTDKLFTANPLNLSDIQPTPRAQLHNEISNNLGHTAGSAFNVGALQFFMLAIWDTAVVGFFNILAGLLICMPVQLLRRNR